MYTSAACSLTQQTQQFIADFFQKNSKAVFSQLHPDIVWIGAADNQYFRGIGPVCQYLTNVFEDLTACIIETQHYDLIYSDASLCIITGAYKGHTTPGKKEMFAASQRVTFIWKLCGSSWKIFHFHMSNPLEFQEKTEYFPHKAGQCTYEYVQSLLQKKSTLPDTLIFHGCNAESYFILPDDICYIEADNIHSIVHTQLEPLTICQPISSLPSILPKEFVQIHRSFIVNKKHIMEAKRYYIRMKNGTKLPIPEKRYPHILSKLKTGS